MDKTIVTAFLVIAGVISVVFMFNALYPAIVDSSNAMVGMERRIDDRLATQIEIIHAAVSGGSNAVIWVKNVGTTSTKALTRCDVFFGPEGNFARIPYNDGSVGTPYWDGAVENDSAWNPTATLRITITYGSVISGRYYVKVVLPNGIADEHTFSQ